MGFNAKIQILFSGNYSLNCSITLLVNKIYCFIMKKFRYFLVPVSHRLRLEDNFLAWLFCPQCKISGCLTG